MSSYSLKSDAPTDARFQPFLEFITLTNVFAQHGEEAVLRTIFDRIGETNRWCFEAGAADGLFFSNTRLLIDQGWDAILVEPDAGDFERLKGQFASNPRVRLHQGFLAALPENGLEITIDDCLERYGAPSDIDLISIDVDGCDYYLLNSLTQFRPRVVIVEYDPDAEPMFIPLLRGPGQAGHLALRYVAEARGYDVVCRTPVNLICVRKDLSHLLMEVESGASSGEPVRQVALQRDGLSGRIAHSGDVTGEWCPVPALSGEDLASLEDWIMRGDDALTVAPDTRQSINGSQPRYQVFAASRWQEYYDGCALEVLPEEQVAAEAGKLPVRVLESGIVKIDIVACMSVPRIGYLDTMQCVCDVLRELRTPLQMGFGVYWHAALTRGIEAALEWRNPAGDEAEFVLTVDYDSIFSTDDVKRMVQLMYAHPEADIIVPAQCKRANGGLLAGGTFNPAHDLVEIETGHFGLTLFRRTVFERLKKPWFAEQPDEWGGWGEGRTDADISLWNNAKANGIKTYLATRVICGHSEEVIAWPKLVDGKYVSIYQPTTEWHATRKPPLNAER